MTSSNNNLTPEQQKLKDEIESGGKYLGIFLSLIAMVLIWVIVNKESYPFLIFIFMIITVPIVYLLTQSIYISIQTSNAKCGECGAQFSVTHYGKEENFLSAIPKKTESITGRSHDGKDIITVKTWTEEKYEIINTYICRSCGELSKSKSYRTDDKGMQHHEIRR